MSKMISQLHQRLQSSLLYIVCLSNAATFFWCWGIASKIITDSHQWHAAKWDTDRNVNINRIAAIRSVLSQASSHFWPRWRVILGNVPPAFLLAVRSWSKTRIHGSNAFKQIEIMKRREKIMPATCQNSAHSMFQIFQLTYVLGPFWYFFCVRTVVPYIYPPWLKSPQVDRLFLLLIINKLQVGVKPSPTRAQSCAIEKLHATQTSYIFIANYYSTSAILINMPTAIDTYKCTCRTAIGL